MSGIRGGGGGPLSGAFRWEPVPAGMHRDEPVGTCSSRMSVPGGWLYFGGPNEAAVFVPGAEGVDAVGVTEAGEEVQFGRFATPHDAAAALLRASGLAGAYADFGPSGPTYRLALHEEKGWQWVPEAAVG